MSTPIISVDKLSQQIRDCRICEAQLPLSPKPVFRVSEKAKLLLVSSAPNAMMQGSGELWSDASGMRLRQWLGIDKNVFNQATDIALVPMGFCYPGRSSARDFSPRPECAETWHPQLFPLLTDIKLIVLLGHHAQTYFLGDQRKKSLTDTVKTFTDYAPRYFPLPHPNPGHTIWFTQHPWFESEVLPELRKRVAEALM